MVGLASNPSNTFFHCAVCHDLFAVLVLVGGLSGLFFTIIVMLASYITTYFMSAFEQPTTSSYYSWSFFYVSPFEVAQDLVVAALRILREGGIDGLDVAIPSPSTTTLGRQAGHSPRLPSNPGSIKRFIKRFLLGLPLIGAGSLVHLLLSVGFLVPVQWLARYRGNRNRREGSRDLAALVVVALLVVGALRFALLRHLLLRDFTNEPWDLKGPFQSVPTHPNHHAAAPVTSRGCHRRGCMTYQLFEDFSWLLG